MRGKNSPVISINSLRCNKSYNNGLHLLFGQNDADIFIPNFYVFDF